MPLTSSIVPYDESWPLKFEEEVRRLKPVFVGHLLRLEHVGSTAVKGLAAKPEIDILVIVSDTTLLEHWSLELETLDYVRGKDLQPGHHFFKRDVVGIRTHKLHICQDAHPQIRRMILIRDHLRENASDLAEYENLKLNLEQENKSGIKEYLDGKAPFLDALFKKITESGGS